MVRFISSLALTLTIAMVTGMRVVKMNSSALSTWYDNFALCLLRNSLPESNFTYEEFKGLCGPYKTSQSFAEGFAELSVIDPVKNPDFARNPRKGCCVQDLSLSERGFEYVIEGFEDGRNINDISVIMSTLSTRAMSMIILGDSISGYMMNAFQLEIQRSRFGDIVRETDWYDKIGVPRGSLRDISERFKWVPPPTGKLANGSDVHLVNAVHIYHVFVATHLHSRDSNHLQNILIPELCTSVHLGGVLLLANLGHHMMRFRLDQNRLAQHLNEFLVWMNDIAMMNRRNIIAFRETTPVHFDSVDGTFERYQTTNDMSDKINNWDHTRFYCRPTPGVNVSTDIDAGISKVEPPELATVRQLISCFGNRSRLSYMPVFAALTPFYRLKYGYCGHRQPEVNRKLDCVHYCANSPPMWAPVWRELRNLVVRETRKRDDEVNSRNISIWEIHKPSQLRGRLWTSELVRIVRSGKNESEHYILVGCVRHSVRSAADAYLITYRQPESYQVETLEESVLAGMVEGRALESFPDGSLVSEGGKSLYITEKNYLRLVPNMDVFYALQLEGKKVNVVSISESNNLKMGPDVPVL